MSYRWLWDLGFVPLALLWTAAAALGTIAREQGRRKEARLWVAASFAIVVVGGCPLVYLGLRGCGPLAAFLWPFLNLLWMGTRPTDKPGGHSARHIALVWWKRRQKRRGKTPAGVWGAVDDDYYWRRGRQNEPAELIASAAPAGRGTEMEASAAPVSLAQEMQAAGVPEGEEDGRPPRPAERNDS